MEIGSRLSRPAIGIGVAVAIAVSPAVAHDLTFDHLIQQEDTRTQAFDWLDSHVPAGGRVAMVYFAGPAHDQAMIDRGNQSHGATDRYVASFLQNRLETRYSVHELQNSELISGSIDGLLSDGTRYVVYSPIAPRSCAAESPLRQALVNAGTLVAHFSPTSGPCSQAVFDPIDAYFVPLSGYGGWVRPGPSIEIYQLQPAP
jgi:hypothetical protein